MRQIDLKNQISNIKSGLLLLAPQSGAHRRSSNRDFHPIHPRIAFEHLSLYIQKHLGQSVVVRGSLWKGRSWQTRAEPGTAGHSQVQARYSQVMC